MLSLRHAFETAGYHPPLTPEQRLDEIGAQIMREHGIVDWSQHLDVAIAKDEKPEELLAALYAPFRQRAHNDLFIKIRDKLKDQGESVSGEVNNRVSQDQANHAASETDQVASEGIVRPLPQGQAKGVPSEATKPKPKPSKRKRERYSLRELQGKKIIIARLHKFRSIYGQPLDQVTRGTARRWIHTGHRDVRFVELLISPMTDDSMVIGDWYQDADEVEKLWRMAQAYDG